MYSLHHVKIVVALLFYQVTSIGVADELDLSELQMNRGILGVIGLDQRESLQLIEIAADRAWTIYFQSDQPDLLKVFQDHAANQQLLGQTIFAALGSNDHIQLADNVADCLIIGSLADGSLRHEEILRSLRPGGTAFASGISLTKDFPEGVDDWSHPYHGPDNNPQSTDQLARGSFRTQFIGDPMFSPMPEQTVIANGKIYKAMGHLAHKENQNEMLNTLLCINAYNGTILWRRSLPEGFMIHRNTMIATEDGLLLGDNESCKFIDAETGEITRQIRLNSSLSDGSVWKWMALSEGILYALVGGEEIQVETQRSERRGLGHWPWNMWKGHDYNESKSSFGFGRTLIALHLKSEKIIWAHRSEDYLDARGICMNDNDIYCYSPDQCLTAIDRQSGMVKWRNESHELLTAIGKNEQAQHYITGYATTCYLKCNQEHLFFAGPQRKQTVVASTEDGRLEWTHPVGNLQLVLRDDGIWAAGPQKSENGVKLDYKTGTVLATFPARRACTRATGCIDSIFFRANGGTVRVLTDDHSAQHFDPMRPPCQDGVLVAGGHLYWGPWMCGCQLSLYGNIGLRPESEATYQSTTPPLKQFMTDETADLQLEAKPGDWTTFRGSSAHDDRSVVPIAKEVEVGWQKKICADILVTAATTANGRVFVADRRGIVQSFDQSGNQLWSQTTDGPIYFAPTIDNGRVFVGSADGKVHAYSAATGDKLWSFRVGPNSNRIPVFGSLISAWPVSGGVVYHKGVVFAAAGLTHYDGTHIVALDAATGELIAANRTSGTLQDQVNNGISLQGELTIVDNELRFLAGGVYETARYELESLKCLNSPKKQVDSQYRTAFYPYYPNYGKYISLDYQCKDGCDLSHDASYEGSQFVNLARYPKRPENAPKIQKEAARWIRRGGKMPQPLWQDTANRRFTCFAITDTILLAGGHLENQSSSAFIAAIDTSTGDDLWLAPISHPPVKGGISIGHDGRIYVVLENGQLICLQPK